jgi:cell wall assembly regulator SMI1/predicted DNA-binding WGR domain protein
LGDKGQGIEMSELDDDLKDIDYESNWDEDRPDIEPLLAKLDRIQGAIARREKGYSAAVEVYNAAIEAAYDQFREASDEYLRFKNTAQRVCSAIELEMRQRSEQKEEESPEWSESEEGRRLDKWLDVWTDFDQKVGAPRISRPEPFKLLRTRLSKMIAALPRRPDDLKLSEVPKAAADRRIDPKVTASVAASWKRIDAWLQGNAPMLATKMNAGAKPGTIAEAERTLGVEFPDAVRASYAVHNGSGIMSLFPSGDYLSLEDMLSQYKVWKELVDEGLWDEEESEPEGPIQKVHYHLKWIPLTHNGGGDHTLIDLAPAKGGKVGQLIDFGHEGGPEGIAATGLSEYLAYIADGLEAGAATEVEATYLEWKEGPVWKRSGYDPAVTRSALKEGPVDSTKRYFEFIEGASSKFWEVSCEGIEMTTRYGKIGTNGQSSTKSFDSPEKAATETAKIIAKKVKEGYVEKTP